MNYQSINPFNGKTLENFSALSDAELEAALASANACFAHWSGQSFAQRATVALAAAHILRNQTERFAQLATLEMGKLIAEAREEVLYSADIIEYYAQHAEEFLAPTVLHPKVGAASVHNVALGVLLGVEPWNFPFYQLARFAAPNLMAGNVVLVKHAGRVPQCALAFERLWQQAGAPVAAYTNLRPSYAQIERVIADPRVRGVAFTGSVDAGRKVAAQAGKNLKKTIMELGGSDAFIVLEDADIKLAVHWAVSGRMRNAGQSCAAAKRFIVVEAVADAFLDQFRTALAAFKSGDPLDAQTTLGPLSSEEALEKLLAQVKTACAHGAKLLLGGKRSDRAGAFMQASILSEIAADNPAFHEEFFGPVALFFRVKDEDAAISLANNSNFGLAGC